jgi:hypothetical protein
MALSLILGEAQLVAEQMDTKAEVTPEKEDDGYSITSVHLMLRQNPQRRSGTVCRVGKRGKVRLPRVEIDESSHHAGRNSC